MGSDTIIYLGDYPLSMRRHRFRTRDQSARVTD